MGSHASRPVLGSKYWWLKSHDHSHSLGAYDEIIRPSRLIGRKDQTRSNVERKRQNVIGMAAAARVAQAMTRGSIVSHCLQLASD